MTEDYGKKDRQDVYSELSLRGHLADYMNGHLNMEQQKRLEADLGRDAELDKELAFDHLIKNAVTENVKVKGVEPAFSDLENRLMSDEKSVQPWFSFPWPQHLVAAFVGAALCFCLALILREPAGLGEKVHPDYVTLTDSARVYKNEILRVVGINNEALAQLVEEYRLPVLQRYPNAVAIDVKISAMDKMSTVSTHLAKDDRVRFLEVLEIE